MPQGPYLRKYGVAAVVPVTIYSPDGASLMPTASFDTGDIKVSKDEGLDGNVSVSQMHQQGNRYYLSLLAAEVTAARVTITIKDQTSPSAFLDTTIEIETYGHAAAQHEADLDTALATSAQLASTVSPLAADVSLLVKSVRNRKVIEDSGGGVWVLKVYDDNDSTVLFTKVLKDKDGGNITPLTAGKLARELKAA